jgi:beta-xylosidase
MRYTNPILFGDYSDPDVIRVNDDFYMISSSFTYFPSIPVLHSKDLVNWELISYVCRSLPFDRYNTPQHGSGTWAPSIRYHNGVFYVYVCSPDEGLFCFTADDPAGEWEMHHVLDVVGWIDPCPLFDDDGSVYLAHSFAASRIGINNVLYMHRMSDDGLKILDKGLPVVNGADYGDVTIEGTKLYKRDGTYWIFCPEGGVVSGIQLVFRSGSIYGPYERRVVLTQGQTRVNGPHQGGWVDDGHGGNWFIHFQDVGAYGRITHLQPLVWKDNWPVIGDNGQPTPTGVTPLERFKGKIPTSDDFRRGLGLQWQWQANPQLAWYREMKPGLRLYSAPCDNLFRAGNFLSQLMQQLDFDFDVSVRLNQRPGDRIGVGMVGYTYYYLCAEERRIKLIKGVSPRWSRRAIPRVVETVLEDVPFESDSLFVKMRVMHAQVSFFWGEDADHISSVGSENAMSAGGWTSARPGIFACNYQGVWGGWGDFEFVKVSPLREY